MKRSTMARSLPWVLGLALSLPVLSSTIATLPRIRGAQEEERSR